MREHLHHLREELGEHLPYTIFSVAVGLGILGMLTFVAELLGAKMAEPAHGLFHVFHPLHMLFSAAATTAMFWRHERKVIKAVVIGFLGAVGVCGMSDILIPYISGWLLGVEMELHICIIKHPMVILPFTAMGIFLGLVASTGTHKSTIFSHAGHVLVSSMASILYLVSYGLSEWMHVIGLVFIYMVLAVIIPCCTSDIAFPLLLTEKGE
ncbi:hypothetical protein LR007_02100 [candidate division NPL-UPA2 bacterium]|nr:hypothetical protein [candidate division NPL-UPA2 bacterium]